MHWANVGLALLPSPNQVGSICQIMPGLYQMRPNRLALTLGCGNFHPWARVEGQGDQSRCRAGSSGRPDLRESNRARTQASSG